ncbi:transposase, Ptta/En/Spm, transposase, Tnp1/En/Spm-like protein [Tanacetum coccineum]|uniref:Transposase, Ptta/En/Spm, transposase, Tnp1/En/Spm-like protein n=1 Tax=Tanacetum coccineum TaxID=301880 RepID=A0ABQ5ECB2_9ASTR
MCILMRRMEKHSIQMGNVVKRGITRLYKFRMEYGKPDGIKLSVTFDALNRISEKHKALFSSLLGDMVHEHTSLKILSWKKVDSEARDKLWDEISDVYWEQSGKLVMNVKSAAAKMARSKSIYQHTMGRGGYTHVKQKMVASYFRLYWFNLHVYVFDVYKIENKEIEPDEEPPRGIMWLKGRVNKDGQFPDDEIRSVGDKLKETKDKIKEGTLKVDHGTDAMTVVLGKEKGGYARGVGSGVTYKRYFDLPRSRQASDERIALLKSQLDNERRERQEKELEIQNLSNKMSETEGMVTKLMNQLAAQGEQLQSMSTKLTPSDVSPVDINPIDNSADEEGGTPLSVVGCENDASIQKSNGLATSEKEMETRETVNSVGSKKTTKSLRKESSRQHSQSQENVSPLLVLPQAIKCKLWHLKKSTIIALGTVYKTDGKQMLHNKELPKDCYKVSVDKSLVDATCIPDVGNNSFKIVKDAVGGFFAWLKNQGVLDPKATPPSTIQMIGENKTAPKLQSKRKNIYVSHDTMQKQARMKSQKSLDY